MLSQLGMPSRVSLLTALFCVALFSACGGSVDRSAVSASADVFLAACENLHARRIAYSERCTGPRAGEDDASVASCAGIVASPGVSLTPADLDACAAQVDAAPCLGGGVFPGCTGYAADLLYPNHARKGTLAPGQACFAGVQCDSAYCGAAYAQCGVCQRARRLGDTCDPPPSLDVCIMGECISGTCQLPGGRVGEECIGYGEPCQAPLRCKTEGSIHGVCLPRPPGVLCAADWCEAPLVCGDGTRCQSPTPEPTGLGEGADCSRGFCRADLSCDGGNVCRAVYLLPSGARCQQDGRPLCAHGLYCHAKCRLGVCGGDGECQAMPQPGEHCTPLAECAETATCSGFDPADETKGTCARLGKRGEACPCAGSELSCQGGTCQPYGPAICR